VKVAVLGTGMVGQALATKLVELGHEVTMGSRTEGNEKAVAWAESAGANARHGTFADAAAFGELIVHCTAGMHSLAALGEAGVANLSGKVLIDVANPLDFSGGFPPTLAVCNTDSLGEQIQSTFEDAKVVKALNTMNCNVMVDPGRVPGDHAVFMCGEDAEAKSRVADLLRSFGWSDDRIVDLGGIRAARGLEMYLPLWLSMMGAVGSGEFNIGVMRAA
jgi:8-hydroxy-5-deazaflavin:NADPH oxidoreductase